MAIKLLYSLLVLVEIIFVPLYLKKMWPTKNWHSLCYKMICATGYMLVGCLAIWQNGRVGEFTKLMMIGLALSWLGDLFLHIPKGNDKVFFATGALSFLTAHGFFIAAYMLVQRTLLPGTKALSWQEIVIAVAAAALMVGVCLALGVRFEMFLVPCCIYGVGVSLMMVKAVSLGIGLLRAGAAGGVAAALLFIAGGLCFFQSDASLALITFGTRFKIFKLKVYNIVTYFAAQVFLATTIFLID